MFSMEQFEFWQSWCEGTEGIKSVQIQTNQSSSESSTVFLLFNLYLDKYNLHFGQIHFAMWTNTFYNLYITKQSIFIREEHHLLYLTLVFPSSSSLKPQKTQSQSLQCIGTTITLQCCIVVFLLCGLATTCGAASECHYSWIKSKSNWN